MRISSLEKIRVGPKYQIKKNTHKCSSAQTLSSSLARQISTEFCSQFSTNSRGKGFKHKLLLLLCLLIVFRML
ncbi:hypothetical protein L1987_34042 [Smallanthus sonchifolius]|uniref:Uncharacterized protein n=1 Tax=Smallanthus sonchifolius TaxID=185202 RepID=A0ACB9HTJ9_9ASTR|nr:hypothetical protein L1987_34042 [Smallanthus sonchifolius]